MNGLETPRLPRKAWCCGPTDSRSAGYLGRQMGGGDLPFTGVFHCKVDNPLHFGCIPGPRIGLQRLNHVGRKDGSCTAPLIGTLEEIPHQR